jgi:hypothetical protein
MALSVLVFGITNFAGFADSFDCTAGLACNGFVAVFVFSVVGVLTTGFFTGSALGASLATLAGGGVTVFFCTAGNFAGTAFFTSSFLGAGFAVTGDFAIGFTGAFATVFALTCVEAFVAFAGKFFDGDGFAFAGADLTAFLGGTDLLVAFAAGLTDAFFAGWAPLPDFLVATFFVAIRFLPFF